MAHEHHRDLPGAVALIRRLRDEDMPCEPRLKPRVTSDRRVRTQRDHIADAQRHPA
jgi:hypothetical protein